MRPDQLEVLRAYAAGQLGTRRAIDALELWRLPKVSTTCFTPSVR
jgi:hypothetical protein